MLHPNDLSLTSLERPDFFGKKNLHFNSDSYTTVPYGAVVIILDSWQTYILLFFFL